MSEPRYGWTTEDGQIRTGPVAALESQIASLRTQVETLNGWKEGALVGTAEMRKEVAFWRDRAESAEAKLAELGRFMDTVGMWDAFDEWKADEAHKGKQG